MLRQDLALTINFVAACWRNKSVPLRIMVSAVQGVSLQRYGNQQMYISIESLLVILLIGLVAGWLASKIVEGAGIGLIIDTAIVIACAFSGSWIMPRSGIHIGSGLVSSTVVATIGAVFLLVEADWWRFSATPSVGQPNGHRALN